MPKKEGAAAASASEEIIKSTLEKIPDLVVEKHTIPYLTQADQSALALTSRAHHQLFQTNRLLTAFLHHVAKATPYPNARAKTAQERDPSYTIAEHMLRTRPDLQTLLLTQAGTFTDHSYRTFTTTAFSYVLWALDSHMIRMFLSTLPEGAPGDAIKAGLLEQYKHVRRNGLDYTIGCGLLNSSTDPTLKTTDELSRLLMNNNGLIHYDGAVYYLDNECQPKTLTPLDGKRTAYAGALLEKLPPDVFKMTVDEDMLKATESTHQHVRGELHFDIEPLKIAYQTYMNNVKTWPKEKRIAHWCTQVGGQQRSLPMHMVNEYCYPDRSFNPRPTFDELRLPRSQTINNWVTEREVVVFPSGTVSPGNRLGLDFGIYRACLTDKGEGSLEGAKIDLLRHMVPSVDQAAVTALCEVRRMEVAGLTPSLQPTHSLAVESVVAMA